VPSVRRTRKKLTVDFKGGNQSWDGGLLLQRQAERVLELAREMGMLKLGTVALDGTKIHRHSALSYEHAGEIEAQLKAESGRPDGAGGSCGSG
jgi:hypothetical protein